MLVELRGTPVSTCMGICVRFSEDQLIYCKVTPSRPSRDWSATGPLALTLENPRLDLREFSTTRKPPSGSWSGVYLRVSLSPVSVCGPKVRTGM